VFLELFLAASDYLDFCIANGYSTLHERRDLLSRQFFSQCVEQVELSQLPVTWSAVGRY